MSTEALAARLQEALGPGYQVESSLGEGGFARVFLVRDLYLKQRLAVKVLQPDLITSKTVMEPIRPEAETVAQLSHPHIVPLHSIGQKDDLLYLVMECIDGGSLADRIDREGRGPPDEVTRILKEVASALDYAHKRGVIHRDIKPHNVLLEKETGRSLVTDFGIARTAEAGSLTATGILVGNPPDAPSLLRDVIEGMLASDPALRFQSAGDVVRALDGLAPASGGFPTGEMLLRSHRCRMGGAALGIGLACPTGGLTVESAPGTGSTFRVYLLGAPVGDLDTPSAQSSWPSATEGAFRSIFGARNCYNSPGPHHRPGAPVCPLPRGSWGGSRRSG